MVKLVVTDIDGTLVAPGGNKLNPAYFDVFRQLTDKGIHIALATGRHAVSVEKTFTPVLDRVWILSQNGAVLCGQGETRLLHPIPNEWLTEFWQDLSRYPEADSILDTATETFSPFADSPMFRIVTEEYGYNLSATGDWAHIPDKEFSMVTIYHPEDADRFCQQYFYDKWQGRLNMMCTGQHWVDCTMPGICKGAAVRSLCAHLGISPSEAIAFGDQINDISMLEIVGTAYAVDNARPETKQAADFVIPGYAEDGVLQVLKTLL